MVNQHLDDRGVASLSRAVEGGLARAVSGGDARTCLQECAGYLRVPSYRGPVQGCPPRLTHIIRTRRGERYQEYPGSRSIREPQSGPVYGKKRRDECSPADARLMKEGNSVHEIQALPECSVRRRARRSGGRERSGSMKPRSGRHADQWSPDD